MYLVHLSPQTSPLTQDSPIPVWLSIQGLTICGLFIILFCGDTNQYFQVRMLFSSLTFLFLTAWSAAGIVWSMKEELCSPELITSSSVIAILSLTLTILIILSFIYWKMSRPEDEGKLLKSRQKRNIERERDHTIFMLEEF